MAESEEFIPEEEAVGPKKSFWAHLNDLRTALVRSCIAIGVALIVCLLFSERLIAILEYPLARIDMFEAPQPTVSFQVGATKLGPYPVTRDQFPGLPPGPAPQVVFQVGAAQVGQEQVATLKLLPAPPPGAASLRVRLHNFGPAEAFLVAFHVALYGALIVSAPFWAFFMGQFFLPALNIKERRLFFRWIGWSVLLFFAGVAMTYFFLLPLALRASIEYSRLLGFEAFDWKADDYIGFVSKFIFGMGLGFQFPIVVLLLVQLGLVTHQQLAKYRRHVAVLSLVLGAVLTTPEVITQVAMAVPLYILYESCIWIAWYWDWKKRRAEAGKTPAGAQ
ncbi:MAG: Sec-independent protein translocase, TatC subunit [Verrucomicrobia bacterium]|nr:Sec-independent protein translocase, TatC subunit [Verrucomicrobiota bacterium]